MDYKAGICIDALLHPYTPCVVMQTSAQVSRKAVGAEGMHFQSDVLGNGAAR